MQRSAAPVSGCEVWVKKVAAQGLSLEQRQAQLADQATPVSDSSLIQQPEPVHASKPPIWEVIAERAKGLPSEIV